MKIRDIIFLAVIAAAITLSGFVTVPLVVAIPLPGIRMVTPALLYGLFLTVGVMRVRKVGSIFIPMLLNGLVLLMMSPVMFANCLISGIVAEGITLLIFKNFESDRATLIAGGITIPLWFPGDFLIGVILGGEQLAQYTTNPWIIIPIFLASVILSFTGAFAGLKIGRELKKAGVLKTA